MKVGVYLDQLPPKEGGGYVFQKSVVQALLGSNYPFQFYILTYTKESQSFLIGCKAEYVLLRRAGLLERAISKCKKLLTRKTRSETVLNKACDEHGIDIVYFPTYAFEEVDIPYIYTIWDLQHRLQPYFPEVSQNGVWEAREEYLTRVTKRASYIVTGTERGATEIMRFYNIHQERIKIIPLPLPSYIEESIDWKVEALESLIEPFILYPAQLWPHKNHVTLFKAIKRLKDEGLELNVVCTGSDKGEHKTFLLKKMDELGLSENVVFKGFVSEKELISFYKRAEILVFPSFFGPDNIPPLEAMALSCPVIVANVPGSQEQYGDSVLYFDPCDVNSLVEQIKRLYYNDSLKIELIRKGLINVRTKTLSNYTHNLLQLLDHFSNYRSCWSKVVS